MRRRVSRRAVAVATVALVPALAGGWILQSRTTRDGAQLLEQVMGLVSQRYVDTVGAGALYEKAARGLVKELNDPYSELFTPKQIAEFSRQTNGRYGGIGMEINKVGEWVTVARVFPEHAGRRPRACRRATASCRSTRRRRAAGRRRRCRTRCSARRHAGEGQLRAPLA
jgi:carboxyl-terminal processing protease